MGKMGTGLLRRVRYFRRMSVAEIKEELHRLSPEERNEISRALAALSEEKSSLIREVQPTDADLPAAMDAVFSKHRDLLGRLAQ